jgi:hypothetical protein
VRDGVGFLVNLGRQ